MTESAPGAAQGDQAAKAGNPAQTQNSGAKLEMVLGITKTGSLVTNPKAPDTFFHPIGNGIRCVHDGKLSDTTLLQGHDGAVNCVSVSKDGTRLASSQLGVKTDVILWDLKTFEKTHVLSVHDLGVQCLCFSEDSRLLASVGTAKDDRVYLWDTRTGNYVCNASLKGLKVENACWRGDVGANGEYVFVTCGQDGCHVWKVNPYQGLLAAPLGCNTGSIKRHCTCVLFGRDQSLFYCGTTSGDLLSFTYGTRILRDVHQVCKGKITALVALPGGAREAYLLGSDDRSVYLFDAGSGTSARLLSLDSGVTSIALCGADPQQDIYVTTEECTVWRVSLVGNASGGAQWKAASCSKLEENHPSAVTCVTTCPGQQLWFSSDESGNLCAWDSGCRMAGRLSLRASKQGASASTAVASMSLLRDGRLLVGKTDGNISMYRVGQGGDLSLEWELEQAHRGASVTAVTCDGAVMASGSSNGEVKVWDQRTRRLLSSRNAHSSVVTGVELISAGEVVVTVSKDTQCKYYNWRKNISGVFFVMEASRLAAVCVTRPCERVLVSVGSDKYLTTWNLERTETEFSVQAHTEEATCVSLSPSNDLVCTGGRDRCVRVWTKNEGRLVCTLEGHPGPVTCARFLSEAKIVSADESGCVVLWDVSGCA